MVLVRRFGSRARTRVSGACSDPLQQLLEIGGQRIDRADVEEILVVLEVARDALAVNAEFEREVETREPDVDRNGTDRRHAGQLQQLRVALPARGS